MFSRQGLQWTANSIKRVSYSLELYRLFSQFHYIPSYLARTFESLPSSSGKLAVEA